MANTKVAEPGASDQTAVAIDRNTLARLKTLAGPTPVARYLRDLTNTLASDCPPTLDDLAGGYSLAPVKAALSAISHELDLIQEYIKVEAPKIQKNEDALGKLIHQQGIIDERVLGRLDAIEDRLDSFDGGVK